MPYAIFIIQTIVFLTAALLIFTIPGIFLLRKCYKDFSFWEEIILGTVVGYTFFSLLSYLLSFIRLHFLLLPLFLVLIFLAFKNFLTKKQITFFKGKQLFLILLVFILGVVGQLLIISPSGSFFNGDLFFWSSHGHDGLWHISLMNEYQKGYPLQNPIFAGGRLVNYHFFSDIAPSDFNYFFKFSSLDLYFRFFPLIFSILLGCLSYLLGKRLGGSFQAGILATFFSYFAGSFGYIYTYIHNRQIGGESLFWASQIQSSSGNPPLIASLVIFLAFIYLFYFFLRKYNPSLLLICTLLAGSLAEFKIYGSVVLLFGLAALGIWQVIKEMKVQILTLFFLSAILSIFLYLPNSAETTSFLIFQPWWFIRTMIVAPDRLNWVDLELKRQTYIQQENWKRVLQIELTGFVIFFFGNLGLRSLGLFTFFKNLKNILTDYLGILLTLVSFTSFILPILFLQKGVAANSIQFFQYFLLIFGIFAGISLSVFLNKIKSNFLKVTIVIIVVLLAIPTQVSLVYSFYSHPPFAKIEAKEMAALLYLKGNTQQDAIILTPPINKDLNLKLATVPIWAWSDTGYISAFSNRRSYISDIEQLDIMGYNFKERFDFQTRIFKEENPIIFRKMVLDRKINYIYFPEILQPKVNLDKTGFKRFFANNLVEIWKVE